MRRNFLIVALMLCLATAITHLRRDLVVPEAGDLQTFPTAIGQWTMTNTTVFNSATLKVLGASDYLMRSYRDSQGHTLGLYIGFHNGGPGAGPIHSPRNCLPGAGWHPLESREIRLPLHGETLNLVRAVYAKEEDRRIFYYWYQMRDKTLTTDMAMKLAELKGVFLDRRKDASFIRIDLPAGQNGDADALVREFLDKTYPLIRQYLPS